MQAPEAGRISHPHKPGKSTKLLCPLMQATCSCCVDRPHPIEKEQSAATLCRLRFDQDRPLCITRNLESWRHGLLGIQSSAYLLRRQPGALRDCARRRQRYASS